jgi:hypothetical protein
MSKNLTIKLVHFLGWVIFALSLCIVIAGLLANNGESFEFGLIGFFAILGSFGFFLTRYKREKKVNPPQKEKKPGETLAEKLQKQKEKSIQKQMEIKKQIEAMKNAPKQSIPVKIEKKPEEKAKIVMDVEKKDIIQTVESIKDQQIRIATLERLITDYQKSYYNGEADISDTEFDRLWDELKALCPESQVLARIEKDTKIDEIPIEDLAYREVVDRRKSENTLFHIEYVDSMGEESSRDIDIQGFKIENDYLYIYAYCYLAKDRRQFRTDRIVSISCEGRTIQNPKQFLWDMYTNSPLYKTQQALNEHTDEILALVFLARADGKMLKNEREIIGRYIDLVVPGIDAEAVEKILKNTACELAEFNKILKRAKFWGPDIKKLVIDAASQIFALKKQSDPMEQGTFEKLKATMLGI